MILRNEMELDVFSILERRIKEYKSSIEQYLASGGAVTQEIYWKNVGKYEALSVIEEELRDIEKRYIES